MKKLMQPHRNHMNLLSLLRRNHLQMLSVILVFNI